MIGPKLAQFMVKFLFPDFGVLRASLEGVGLDPVQAEQIVEESHSSRGEIMEGIRRTARMTLRLFEQCGLWQDSRIRDSFEQEGLLVQTSETSPEESTEASDPVEGLVQMATS